MPNKQRSNLDLQEGVAIHLFRDDLRVDDHPALIHAAGEGSVLPVFIWDKASYGSFPPGGASLFWLKRALKRLDQSLQKIGSRLFILEGDTLAVLKILLKETRASSVTMSAAYDPFGIALQETIASYAEKNPFVFTTHHGFTLTDPLKLTNKQGSFYKVFTPFWNHLFDTYEAEPKRTLKKMSLPQIALPKSLDTTAIDPSDGADWQDPMAAYWDKIPQTGTEMLAYFIKVHIEDYKLDRDFPEKNATSHLSPFLRFGEISPATVWREVLHKAGPSGTPYLRQIAWREFAWHLLFHRPDTLTEPMRPEFRAYPWKEKENNAYKAWTSGKTGIDIVDAGMHELWLTGIMHNRVRMICASFLVKHLHLSWKLGAKWFWDTLVDADLANNTMGWQWVAGCGADAAPFFRIFNPELQANKFDRNRIYQNRWLEDRELILSAPIIDLNEQRKIALANYKQAISDGGSKAKKKIKSSS